MKTLGIIFVTLSLNYAAANTCPNLGGTYKQNFPTETGAELTIKPSYTGGAIIYDLYMPSAVGTSWTWQVKADGTSYEKQMGSLYKNVYEIARCENKQLRVTLAGEMLDGDKVINFTQEWFIYQNTIGEVVWQTNYHDETTAEPLISIFKYTSSN